MSANPNGTTQYWQASQVAVDHYNENSGYYNVVVSAWVYLTNNGKTQTLFEWSDSSSSTSFWRLAIGAGNNTFFQWNGGGGQFTNSTNTLSTGAWYHVMALLSQTPTKYCYVITNAVDGSKGTATPGTPSSIDTFDKTTIGAHYTSSGANHFLDGYLRDVTVWNGYTTPSDATMLAAAAAIYNSGSRVPASEQTFSGMRLVHSFDLYDDALCTVTGIEPAAVASAGFATGTNPTDRATNAVTITYPQPWQTVQHTARASTIPVSGQYTHDGTAPTAIEARFNGGTWATVDASPAAGQFNGTLASQGAARGTLEARFTNVTAVTDSVANVGIGEVSIAAGQSNISGRGTSTNTANARASGFSIGTGTTTDGHRQLADPITVDSGSTGSYATKWADEFDTRYSSLPLGLVVHALGGTGLYDPTDWGQGDNEYIRLLRTILQSGVLRGGVCSMMWGQGGADAAQGVSEANYETALTNFHDNLQTDTGLTFEIVINRVDSDFVAGSQAIRDAQDDVIAAESDAYAGVDGDVLDADGSAHFVTDAQVLAAAQAFDTQYSLTPCGIGCEVSAGGGLGTFTITGDGLHVIPVSGSSVDVIGSNLTIQGP